MYWIMLLLTFITVIIFPLFKWLDTKEFYNRQLYIKWTKFNSKYKFTRLMTIIVGVIAFALYIGLRWAPILYDTIQGGWFSKSASETRSANISIVLSLDVCSILGLTFPVLAIFNKWEIIKSLAPIATLGAILTIFVTCYLRYNDVYDVTLFFLNTYEVGLVQSDLGPLLFWMHLFILGYAVSAFTWHGRFTKKNWVILLIFVAIYVPYVCTIAYTLDIRSHAMACVKGDYRHLEDSYYAGLGSNEFVTYIAFNDVWPFKQWEWVAVFTWFSFAFLVTVIVTIINIIYKLFDRNKMIMINLA